MHSIPYYHPTILSHPQPHPHRRPHPHPHPYPHPRKLRKQSRTFGRGGAGNVLPSPSASVPVRESDSHSRHHSPSSPSSPSLLTRLFCWIRSFRPRSSSRLASQQNPPTSLPTVGPRDQAFLESLVRYTEDASYRGNRRSNNNQYHTTHPVESSATATATYPYPTSFSPTPRSPNPNPNPNRMSYIRSPHPPSSYHSCSHTTTSRPHPHANHPANSWYSSDADDHSAIPDLDTTSRTSTHSSLFYRPITRTSPYSPTTTQPRPSCVPRKRPEPLKISPTRHRPAPLQVSPTLFSSTLSSPSFRVPSITLSLPSASGDLEQFAFPTPPTHLHTICEPKRSSGYWLAGHTAFVPSSDFTHDLPTYKTEEWGMDMSMEETFDSESISSCRAAEDVELGLSNATFFTHDSGTVTAPTIDLPTPSSETFSFGLSSTVSAHLWGRQAVLKHHLSFSLDESHSTPSHSDVSGNDPVRPGLIIDDEDAEFVGELESVYSAFADMNVSSAGGTIWCDPVFGMDDTMSDTESVTDPHLHSIPVRVHRPRAWMGRT